MRLIDADLVLDKMRNTFDMQDLYLPTHFKELIIDDLPTVEAIPKADIQKALKEGSIDIGKNVLAIVREEYIPKADYENRLKADLVAILDEFDLELYEKYEDTDLIKVKYIRQAIQQKIDKLKEVSE